jgi:hypothetical protein
MRTTTSANQYPTKHHVEPFDTLYDVSPMPNSTASLTKKSTYNSTP